jgi:hypothetical protein
MLKAMKVIGTDGKVPAADFEDPEKKETPEKHEPGESSAKRQRTQLSSH